MNRWHLLALAVAGLSFGGWVGCGQPVTPVNTGGSGDSTTPAAREAMPEDAGTPLPEGRWTITFPDIPKNMVSFISTAEERIAGTAMFAGDQGQVHGSITVDVAAGTASGGSFLVPVKGLRTGNELRDEHLRSADWLHEEAHANIVLRDITAERVTGKNTLWRLRGTMEIKGTAKPFETVANIRFYESFPMLGDNVVRAYAAFPIRIKEFGISNQAVGTPMVSDLWNVEIAVFGFATPATE